MRDFHEYAHIHIRTSLVMRSRIHAYRCEVINYWGAGEVPVWLGLSKNTVCHRVFRVVGRKVYTFECTLVVCVISSHLLKVI